MEKLIHAPKLDAHDLPWFNTPSALDLEDFQGKLVILDFWTYCCINCIHIIPTLRRIEKKFPESVLVIGVHSPKFPGEKVTDNLEQAIHRYEIEHPIVQDSDFTIWKNYAVRAWPTLIFIGPDGYLLGQLSGEPNPDKLEETIGELLKDLKSKNQLEGNAQSLILPPTSSSEKTLLFPGKITYSIEDKEFAIADSNHNQIVTVDLKGNLTRRIGSGDIGQNDGSFSEAGFYHPQGLCYQKGVIWTADTENHLIRKVDLKNEVVETVAGTGRQGSFLGDRGEALKTGLSSPWDISMADGWLYFANAGTHQIGVYHVDENTVASFAGTGQEGLSDGPRFAGTFAQPSGLSIGENKLFLVDSETSAVRSVRLDEAGFIATYVGTGLFDFGDKDGNGKQALLQHPLGVHYSKGRVYIADSYNHKIKVLDLKTQAVTTLVSDHPCSESECSRLWEPAGVVELNGQLYISDTNNHRILKTDLQTGNTEIFVA